MVRTRLGARPAVRCRAVARDSSASGRGQRTPGHLAAQEIVLRHGPAPRSQRVCSELPDAPIDPAMGGNVDVGICDDDTSRRSSSSRSGTGCDDLGSATSNQPAEGRRGGGPRRRSGGYRVASCWLLVDTSGEPGDRSPAFPAVLRALFTGRRWPGSGASWTARLRRPSRDRVGRSAIAAGSSALRLSPTRLAVANFAGTESAATDPT